MQAEFNWAIITRLQRYLQADDEGLKIRTTRLGVSGTTPPSTPWYVFVLTLLSAIGGFLFGYDTGVVAGATLPISEKFKLNTVEKELFVSITG